MATTEPSQFLYMLDEDLYLLGNANSPRLDHVRQVNVDTYDHNHILMVRANGLGISLGAERYFNKMRISGWLWRVPAHTPLPQGLAANPDPNPAKAGHFLLYPVSDMTMDKYRALLSELALRCERTGRL